METVCGNFPYIILNCRFPVDKIKVKADKRFSIAGGDRMGKSKRRITIGRKLYLFIMATIFFTVASACVLYYNIGVTQIDGYYKRLTMGVAKSVTVTMDTEFLKELREVVETDEYMAIRDHAEEIGDDTSVVEFFKEKGLWEKYQIERNRMIQYIENMDAIKYLYIVVWGDQNDRYDMYLIDADDLPFYQTGYLELREEEFAGVIPDKIIEPVISNGPWGWLCSGYAAVCDENDQIICHVGCDVNMENVMSERQKNLFHLVLSAILCIVIISIGSLLFIKKAIVRPLNVLTDEMKKFSPKEGGNYEECGVLNVENAQNDEIGDIYREINSMQTRILDYIKSITVIRRDKEKAEGDIRDKDELIGKIRIDAYRDALTGTGNKAAYEGKVAELNEEIEHGLTEFSVVMIDVNGLKTINDNYGHSNGDTYIKGVCREVREVFKHSPVYRIGGDEFVVILLGEDYAQRQERIAELRTQLNRSFHDEDRDPWLRYSAAVGLADYETGDGMVELTFKRADQCMYEEKMKFKNENGIAIRKD